VGDVIEVDGGGKRRQGSNLHLSRKNARTTRAWERLWKYTGLVKLLLVWLPAKLKVFDR